MNYDIKIGEQQFDVEIQNVGDGTAAVVVNGVEYDVRFQAQGRERKIESIPQPKAAPQPKPPVIHVPQAKTSVKAGSGVVVSQIPGLILDVKVRVGDMVKAGQTIATMEAMKMENPVVSPVSGQVKEIRVQKNSEVKTGDVLMMIE